MYIWVTVWVYCPQAVVVDQLPIYITRIEPIWDIIIYIWDCTVHLFYSWDVPAHAEKKGQDVEGEQDENCTRAAGLNCRFIPASVIRLDLSAVLDIVCFLLNIPKKLFIWKKNLYSLLSFSCFGTLSEPLREGGLSVNNKVFFFCLSWFLLMSLQCKIMWHQITLQLGKETLKGAFSFMCLWSEQHPKMFLFRAATDKKFVLAEAVGVALYGDTNRSVCGSSDVSVLSRLTNIFWAKLTSMWSPVRLSVWRNYGFKLQCLAKIFIAP